MHIYYEWPTLAARTYPLAHLDWGHMPPLPKAHDNRCVKDVTHLERGNFRNFSSKGTAIGAGAL